MRILYVYLFISYPDSVTGDDGAKRELEFLIQGDLLRSNLESHIAKKHTSTVSDKVPSAHIAEMEGGREGGKGRGGRVRLFKCLLHACIIVKQGAGSTPPLPPSPLVYANLGRE